LNGLNVGHGERNPAALEVVRLNSGRHWTPHSGGRRERILQPGVPLSSGVSAALVVFWLGTRRDKQNAAEREKAERTALWRLVDMEIYQNIHK
jgi:hypothetical protein